MGKRLPSEFAINMNLSKLMILQQQELDMVAETNYFDGFSPCHIYFICKRPRITIDRSGFRSSKELLEFQFKIQKEDQFQRLNLKFQNIFPDSDIRLVTEFPFSIFELQGAKGKLMRAKVATFLQSSSRFIENPEFLDLEVLYVGQSYGVEGARTAPDRLRSHSTLQGIYAEAIANNPDSEIWLALASFEQINLMMFDGRTKFTDQEKLEDKTRFQDVFNKLHTEGISEQQKINFTEAALIRYFSPPYNKIYKDSFPNPAHSTYSHCCDLDINSVCIELQTSDMVDCDFYSQTIPRAPWHMKDFLLRSKEERKSMFEIV
jgi:hypothetical protein